MYPNLKIIYFCYIFKVLSNKVIYYYGYVIVTVTLDKSHSNIL